MNESFDRSPSLAQIEMTSTPSNNSSKQSSHVLTMHDASTLSGNNHRHHKSKRIVFKNTERC